MMVRCQIVCPSLKVSVNLILPYKLCGYTKILSIKCDTTHEKDPLRGCLSCCMFNIEGDMNHCNHSKPTLIIDLCSQTFSIGMSTFCFIIFLISYIYT